MKKSPGKKKNLESLNEIPDMENHKESITINGSLTILDNEYEQNTIWMRTIPTKKQSIYVTTRVEKLANEDIEIMYDFIKKHFNEDFTENQETLKIF
jgi:hypothetical protein